ncbi:MAG: hypothetical protein KatS3mg061_0803 [Dehalococcoidia bacterium]|nr:MAG: hypothetical protein KatS3mg061_0803 [Dehalococcoidia bacterium]
MEGRLNAIAQRVPPGSQIRRLNFGIGDGHFPAQAAARGYLPYGYDINPDGFALARELYGLTADFSSAPLVEHFQLRSLTSSISTRSSSSSLSLW